MKHGELMVIYWLFKKNMKKKVNEGGEATETDSNRFTTFLHGDGSCPWGMMIHWEPSSPILDIL